MRLEFEGYAAAHKEMLAKAVDIVGKWITGLKDPELGDVGEAFTEHFAETECRQEIDPRETYLRAGYTSFRYKKGEEGFINRILYGMKAESDLDALFSARVHESTHAMQKKASVALHGSYANPRTRILICPEDWIMLQERCEQDAFTKQAWFCSLLADDLKEIVSSSSGEPISVPDFLALRKKYGNLPETLVGAARAYMDKRFYTDDGDYDDYKFANAVHDSVLSGYNFAMDVRRKRGESFTFVRLGPKDREAAVRAIGGSFGPNSFGEGRILPEFLEGPHLRQTPNKLVDSKSAQTRLDELNKKLGITDYNALPELSDVLAERGMTLESFIADSYENPSPVLTGGSQPSSALNELTPR